MAKSQLPTFVCNLAIRSICTNGRGSLGVGLTAPVTQDTTTNETVLSLGCCLYGFDRMRTAHSCPRSCALAPPGDAAADGLVAANPPTAGTTTAGSPAENIDLASPRCCPGSTSSGSS